MPNPACQSEDGKTAIFIGTFLETGNSVTLCQDDLQAFAVALAQQLTGVPVIEMVNTYIKEHEGEATPAADTVDDDELDAWLNEHSAEIAERVVTGETPEEAIAAIQLREATEANETSPASSDVN